MGRDGGLFGQIFACEFRERNADAAENPHVTLVDLAYEAAVDRLEEQRSRLEGLRTRAAALFSVAGVVVTFATGIGLFGKDSNNGATLPNWCLYSLMGVLLLLGGCVVAALQPTENWLHGPPVDLLLTGAETHLHARIIKERAAKYMWESADDKHNGAHLKKCAHWYRLATGLLGLELLLIVLGVATQR